MAEAEDWSKDCSGWLSLDIQDLSAAMLTIPVHERLSIAKEMFQVSQLFTEIIVDVCYYDNVVVRRNY